MLLTTWMVMSYPARTKIFFINVILFKHHLFMALYWPSVQHTGHIRSFMGPLHRYLGLFIHFLQAQEKKKNTFLALHLFVHVFSSAVPVCGCVSASSPLSGMTGRNLRAAGELSRYPSALKRRRVSKGEGRDRKTQPEQERRRGRQKEDE